MEAFKISNVKFHFHIKDKVDRYFPSCLKCMKTQLGEKDNNKLSCKCQCKVFEWNALKVFVYVKSKTVNISGIKHFDLVHSAKDQFCQDFKISCSSHAIIDNSTAHGHFTFAIDLRSLWSNLYEEHSMHNSNKFTRIKFNPQRFPSLQCKTEFGLINVFSTGSIVILGAKTEHSLHQLKELVESLLSKNGTR